MAPKAVSSKDGKAASGADAAAAAEREEAQALIEAELVTAVLRSRLGRCQAAGEKLAVDNFSLTDELAKQRLTLQDINEFLTSELKARSLATAQLEERVGQLSARLAEVQKEAQAQLARVRAEAAAEVAAARGGAASASASESAQGGAGAAAELQGQKAQLERTVADLTAALAARQKEFESRLSDLERCHLQDKERLRREAAAKIRETKVAMAQLADQHLEGSTKRTLVENETMAAELAYSAAQSSDLVAANTQLRADAGELRRQLAVANKLVQSTAAKNLLLQQTIKSILCCLKEEARLNAEAAIAAAEADSRQQQQQQRRDAGSSSGPCSPTGCASHLRSGLFREQQHRPDSRLHHQVICVQAGQEAHGVGLTQQQQQQQQPDGAVGQLEARVLHLADELTAARQALAAALHAALPVELRSGCSITAAPASGLAAGPRCCCCCSSHVSTCKHGRASRGSSPSSHRQQRCGAVSPQGSRCLDAPAATPMASALDDGVAAFVLFCVQRLRGKAAGTSNSDRADETGDAAGAGTGAGEQLARLLLEQLHSYSRAKLRAYQGMSVAAAEGAQGQDQAQPQSASQVEAWPGNAHAGGGVRSSSPLPGGAPRAAADRDGLLQAVLSDVRPWGPSVARAGGGSPTGGLLCRRSPSPAMGVKADVVLGGGLPSGRG